MKRFWSKVDKSGGCWTWTGALSKAGYGMFRYGGKGSLTGHAHRMAWLLSGQDIPGGLWLLHKCDNRRCVNPGHLFLGTAADNAADCVSKNRQNRGTKHPQVKLDEAAVLDIRARLAAGERGIDVAARYHVTAALISMIRLRQTWRHI